MDQETNHVPQQPPVDKDLRELQEKSLAIWPKR